MKTLIIGLGKSGTAAYELLKREGDEVVGVDDAIPTTHNPDVASFDRIVVSPGIPPSNKYYQEAIKLGKEIIGEAEVGLSRLHQPCAAITGTNGKTTVTLMIEHVLKVSGKKARALGNVGIPFTAYLSQPDEIVVAELSSFQLETLNTAVFDVGVILNITLDHFDRYVSMEEYARAKCRLQKLMKPNGILWVHQDVASEFGHLLQNYQKIETVLPIRYENRGKHDQENVLAAWLICKTFGVDEMAFSAALESFRKPAHRIEFVASIQGVDYVNDSKGTNIDATIKAVETMAGQVVLIAGGVDKGSSYRLWKKSFAGKVRRVIALGQAAHKIEQELKPEFSVIVVSTLKEAVELAKCEAKKGETVLLSPGCSSYDMFRDYAHRGEEFKKLILDRGLK